jgi:2-keto-4-pentenoate hydratase/2-oxohepta-3-ene-1,7-dioic acid hydratase in catechol pathway
VTDIDGEDLHIGGALNGEVRQDSRTSDLLFGLDELVVHVTKYFTMLPGDVIITGTPSGVGTSKGLMKPGDVYEVTIEGIGTLRNRIVGVHGEVA